MTSQHRIVSLDAERLPETDVEFLDNESGTDVRAKPELGANPEHGTSYLPDPALGQAGARWQQIQAGFVDDPRRSVAEAHKLVDDLMERIVQEFTRERGALEQQWSKGEQVSTEDLRICLQRYRSFFNRLLPASHDAR